MNHYICVGRLVSDPELKQTENGKNYTNMTIAVPRSYKNAEGEYETDFVDCTIWGNSAGNTVEYCKKGDMVGIKGRLETKVYETSTGEKRKATNIVADKITFIQSGSKLKTYNPELE